MGEVVGEALQASALHGVKRRTAHRVATAGITPAFA